LLTLSCMRRFLRILAQVLVLIIVALASTLVSMRFAIHGREVAVPDLRGMAPAEAKRAALDRGLVLVVSERFYSDTVPAGRIVSQQPDPGTRVRRGWRMQGARSLGPQRIDVPALVGMSPRAAEIDIRRRGLRVGSFAQLPVASPSSPSAKRQTVLAQSPSAGAQGIASPRIGLLYSAPAPPGAYVMPDLTGMTVAEAGRLATAAGLKFDSVSVASAAPVSTEAGQTPASGTSAENSGASSKAATIVAQSPPPGSRVTADTGLTLRVTRPL
jgi:beta-lactam-binding protein with PASTA domain